MNIGQAADASGVSAKMIRYYEAIGLIARAERSSSGYRHYGDADVHTLRFIRRARDLGFSVEQIAGLLALWRDKHRVSAQVEEIARAHVAGLQQKVRDMQAMIRTLSTLAEKCEGDERPDCPIIDDLVSRAGRRGLAAPDHRFGSRSVGVECVQRPTSS